MNKFTRLFLFLTFGTVLLIGVYSFSPLSSDANSSKTSDKLSTSRIMVDKNKSEFEILLGQTKYYQAVMDDNWLKIIESTEPVLNGGTSDVAFEVTKETRDTLGVYYDNMDDDGNILPSGMIKLVGRYWKEGESFKVRLTAKRIGAPLLAQIGHSQLAEIRESGGVTSIVVEVERPSELGTADNTITDVFGKSINIDDLIIKYAGENGIPPQLIKAQMDQESSFEPKWRYEPFQDAQKTLKDAIFQNDKFVMTENSTGGAFPTNHTNVQPVDYNRTQIKISQYLVDNWFSIYVQRGGTNAPDVILGSESDKTDNFTAKWEAKWKEEIILKAKNPKDLAHDFVKSLITDTKIDLGKRYDRLAQTRIVTSYGFTQMFYPTAITDGKFNKETIRARR